MDVNRYHFPVLVLAFICNRHVSGQTSQMVDICQTIQIQYTGGVSVSTPNYPNLDTNTDASCQCLITWTSTGRSNVTLSYTEWSFSGYISSCWGWLDYQNDVSSAKSQCLSNTPSNPIINKYTTNGLLLRYSRVKTTFDRRGKFLLAVNVSPPETIIIVSCASESSMVYPGPVQSTAIPPGSSYSMPPESTNAPMPSTQFQSANPSSNPASTRPTMIPPQPASVQPPQPSLPQPTSTTTQSIQLSHSSSQNGTSTTTTSSNITSNNNSSIIPDPLTTNDETANGLATSSIIGIAVGVGGFFIIATIVVIVVACLMCRRSQEKEKEKEKEKVELELKNASIRSRPAVPLPVSDPEGIRTENAYQLEGEPRYMEIQEAQKKPVPGPGNIVFQPPENGNDVNGTGLYYRVCDMTSAKIPRSAGDVPNNNSGSTSNANNDVIYVTPGNSTLSAQQENARNESSGPTPGTSDAICYDELKLKLTGMSSVRIC